MFSLTNEQRVFKSQDPSKAVHHSSDNGPRFDNALGVFSPMNGRNNGFCETEGMSSQNAKYCVPRDSRGNSVLTGDNANKGMSFGWFTVVGLEVFLIE